MERLNDKKIIVTGGASGMGGALVEVFPSLGAKVVSFDMNDERQLDRHIFNEQGCFPIYER